MTLWLSRFAPTSLSSLLSKVILLILVIFLGWQIGKLVTQYLAVSPVLIAPAVVMDNHFNTVETNQYTETKQTNLLLGYQPSQSIKTIKQAELSEARVSKLNVKVLGIVALSNERGVVVLLSDSKTILVKQGEQIQNNIFLEAVYPDYIVINHNGQSEKLLMNSEPNMITSSFNAPEITPTARLGISRLSNELRGSPMKITQYVRFKLMSRGGQVIAIKVWPKSDVELFNALGFQPGDLVQKINGSSITKLMGSPVLWQKMLNEMVFEMDIDRKGSHQTIIVNLNKGL